MGDQNPLNSYRSPPGSSLQTIEERDSSASTSTVATPDRSPVATPVTETPTTQPSKQTQQQQHQQRLNLGQRQHSQHPVPQHHHPSTPLQEQPPPTPLSARAAVTRQVTEPGSAYYGPQTPYDASCNPTVSQQSASRLPSHSLAGPNMMDAPQQGPVYIDRDYRQLNPRYGRNNEKPVWGLAKPLPRVVRPGMRRDEHDQPKAYEPQPPGQSQPAPELGATPGLTTSNSQSGTAESRPQHSQPQPPPTYSAAAQQGAPRQHAVYAPQQDGILRPMETEASDMPSKAGVEQVEMGQAAEEEFLNHWVKMRHYLKEPLAEFLAVSGTVTLQQWTLLTSSVQTAVAVLIGLSGTLAVSTGGSDAGSRLSANWSWGLGFMVGIYLAGGISGAHLNPGISIALWIFRGFPGQRCCYYVIAQVLGSIVAAGLAFCIYRDAILNLAPHLPPGSSGLGFYTEPLEYVSSPTAFFTEFIADAILLCVIFAMGDDSNAPPGAGMHSFVIGLVIYVLSICLGFNTGGYVLFSFL